MVQLSSRQLNIDTDLDLQDQFHLLRVDQINLTDVSATPSSPIQITTNAQKDLLIDGIQVFKRSGVAYEVPELMANQVTQGLELTGLGDVDGSYSIDDVLIRNNFNKWVAISKLDLARSYLDSLSKNPDDVLTYDGGTYVFSAIPTPPGGIDIDGTADNQTLLWDSTLDGGAGDWKAAQMELGFIKDVVLGTPMDNQVLTYIAGEYKFLDAPGANPSISGNIDLQNWYLGSSSATDEPWIQFTASAIQVGKDYSGTPTASYTLSVESPGDAGKIFLSNASNKMEFKSLAVETKAAMLSGSVAHRVLRANSTNDAFEWTTAAETLSATKFGIIIGGTTRNPTIDLIDGPADGYMFRYNGGDSQWDFDLFGNIMASQTWNVPEGFLAERGLGLDLDLQGSGLRSGIAVVGIGLTPTTGSGPKLNWGYIAQAAGPVSVPSGNIRVGYIAGIYEDANTARLSHGFLSQWSERGLRIEDPRFGVQITNPTVYGLKIYHSASAANGSPDPIPDAIILENATRGVTIESTVQTGISMTGGFAAFTTNGTTNGLTVINLPSNGIGMQAIGAPGSSNTTGLWVTNCTVPLILDPGDNGQPPIGSKPRDGQFYVAPTAEIYVYWDFWRILNQEPGAPIDYLLGWRKIVFTDA
jgi:hypothetical protein